MVIGGNQSIGCAAEVVLLGFELGSKLSKCTGRRVGKIKFERIFVTVGWLREDFRIQRHKQHCQQYWRSSSMLSSLPTFTPLFESFVSVLQTGLLLGTSYTGLLNI